MQRKIISMSVFLFATMVFSQTMYAQEIDFAADIVPILKSKCYRCHGPDEQNGDFRIDDSSRKGDYIEDGDHEFSEFYSMLVGEGSYSKMPPEEEEQLTGAEIVLIREWINQGANWPNNINWEGDGTVQKTANEQEDEDEELTFWPKLWKEIGVLHPAMVHFPIALLTVAGLFSLLALRGSLVMSDIAYACLWLGALGGLAASAVGWSYLSQEGYADLLDFNQNDYWSKTWVWHAWSGIVSSVVAFILALIAAGYRRSDPEGGAVWKLGCILLAALTGLVGHFGGKMQYGSDHYDELLKTVGIMEEEKPADDNGVNKDDEKDKSNGEKAVDENNEKENGNQDEGQGDANQNDASDNGTNSDSRSDSDSNNGEADNG